MPPPLHSKNFIKTSEFKRKNKRFLGTVIIERERYKCVNVASNIYVGHEYPFEDLTRKNEW